MIDIHSTPHVYPEQHGIGWISQTVLEEMTSRQWATQTTDMLVMETDKMYFWQYVVSFLVVALISAICFYAWSARK